MSAGEPGGPAERFELYLEPLGVGGGGWSTEAAGATMGRVVRFATGDEMRAFVADLRSALDALLEARSSEVQEGQVTLMVFLAGHRMASRE